MTKHTILIYPDLAYSEFQRPAPPYSVLFIANALQKAGVDVEIFDLRHDTIDDVVHAAAKSTPDYIGLSVMTGPQIRNALEVTKALRQNVPESKLVWGGIHPTILPLQTLHHPDVDLVIQGDGERAYTQLVQNMAWKRIQGLVFKQKNRIHNGGLAPHTDMSTVTVPWELVDPRRYITRGRTSALTSRGCPYRCTFCYNAILRQPWRGWNAQQCQRELDHLIALGADDILFFDDAFFTNKARVRKLLPYFHKEGLAWTAELRVDQLTSSLARDVKRAGCKCLFFGAESGSPRLLQLLNKKITVHQLVRSSKITKSVGVRADYSWMVGIPTETPEDRRVTIATIKGMHRINPEAEFVIKIFTPYPGTPLFEMALKEGARLPQSLTGWSGFSRYRGLSYLRDRRQLETLALTSALVGRQMIHTLRGPLAVVRAFAQFRWQHEAFGLSIESFVFNIVSSFLEGRRRSFRGSTRSRTKSLLTQESEETFAR